MYQKVGKMPTITDLRADFIPLHEAAALLGITKEKMSVITRASRFKDCFEIFHGEVLYGSSENACCKEFKESGWGQADHSCDSSSDTQGIKELFQAGGKVGYDGQESGNGCDTAEV